MPNSNSQLDGLGSFNQSSENAGTIKYGAFNNAAKNTGTIALSAVFGNTSQNLGIIGDVLPITTATIVQTNSANWDSTYTTVMQNSAMWALSGGVSVTETFVGDVVTSIINTDSFVLTTDSRLSDIPMGVEAYTYLQSNSGDFIVEGDARLTDARTPLAHTHDASAITSGKLDIDRLPVLPTMTTIVIDGIMYDNNAFAGSDENLLIDGFTYVLSSIVEGTVIAINDGYRYVYKGTGGKRFASSYIQLADITPDWSVVTNKPSVFTPDTHTHTISEVIGLDSVVTLVSSNSSQWASVGTLDIISIDGAMYDNNAFATTDENLLIDGFTPVLSAINKGTVIAINDGYRYVYKGEGGKRFASSYIQLADITPDWSVISNKPSVFTPEAHTHTMSEISDLSSHSHTMSDITDLRNTYWDTTFSYVTANSANIVMTSDVRLSRASTAFSYVTANSASIVMTSDSRLANASTAFSYVTANSASIVMTSDSRLANASNAYTAVQTNSATWAVGATGTINYTIDGGGSAITTGSKGFVQVPTNFTVQEWDIIADLQTTSFIVDVRKASYANLPTTSSILGSDVMKLTNEQKNRNLSVSWTNISAGDFVEFYVTDASNASMINISLKGVRS